MSLPLRAFCLLLLGAALSACTGSPHVQPSALMESYCKLEGYLEPLRQTVVVLDEADVAPESQDKPSTANLPWHKLLASLLPGDEGALARVLQPRERVSVLIARADGGGLRPVFAGCVPFYSAAEKKEIAATAGVSGMISSWFGRDNVSAAGSALESFHKGLDASILEALRPAAFSQGEQDAGEVTLNSNGFVGSLRQTGVPVRLDQGLPRIFIYSDMTRYLGQVPADLGDARVMGQRAGFQSRLDFKGADVHVLGLSPGVTAREMLGMFFLACHGELLSAGAADSIPSLDAGPTQVTRYQGTIQFPDSTFTIRLRLATDADGHVLSSWVWVPTATMEQFVPFHGRMDCDGDTCTYKGDHVFAQLWNPAREPGRKVSKLDFLGLRFAGMRDFAFKIKDRNRLTGSIADQSVDLGPGISALKLKATLTSDLF